jgi:IS30 family transposase
MSYEQLTREERFVIYHLRLVRLSVREIARRLNRHHSTISRELKRNGARYPGAVYWALSAQECAQQRRQRARHHRRRANGALCQYVVERLQAHWSPETIAGRLELDFPADAHMRVGHEAIYRWMYLDAKAGGGALPVLALPTQASAQATPLRQLARADPWARIHQRAPGHRGAA